MKHIALSALSACLLLLTSCSKNPHAALMEESTAQMTKLVETLEGVKDKAGWEAAKPKLETVMTTMDRIGKDVKALGEPDEATKKELGDRVSKDVAGLQQRMMQAAMKLAQNEEIAEDVQKFMTDFGKRMSATK